MLFVLMSEQTRFVSERVHAVGSNRTSVYVCMYIMRAVNANKTDINSCFASHMNSVLTLCINQQIEHIIIPYDVLIFHIYNSHINDKEASPPARSTCQPPRLF